MSTDTTSTEATTEATPAPIQLLEQASGGCCGGGTCSCGEAASVCGSGSGSTCGS